MSSSGIINLLPDAVANQIAAGEVVQRPASVVKELIENAIDAKAEHIKLIVKDAGKSLIQIIDDGKGMNERDIRLSVERHATSKISNASDLFNIQSFGFRGEALASISAVSHLEIISKTADASIGNMLQIEGSEVIKQGFEQCATGTKITVSHLFFNTPARRKFLKSDPVEMRHIIDEFQRVAIPNHHIEFELIHNDQSVFKLPKAQALSRIAAIFGRKIQERLVPIKAATDFVKISGYLGAPDAAKKTRGEQFFFVNNRFIKSSYLNHAVQSAFEDLIPKGAFPLYFIHLQVNPESIDINIHPTKTEIKFEDERAIYAVLNAASREAIGKHNLSPSLDFEQEMAFPPPPTNASLESPGIMINPNYNPFESNNSTSFKGGFSSNERLPAKAIHSSWQEFYAELGEKSQSDARQPQQMQMGPQADEKNATEVTVKKPFQLQNTYIISSLKSGLLIIDQKKAHERILFEQYIRNLALNSGKSQTQLFPISIELSQADSQLLREMWDTVHQLGFIIEPISENVFNVIGTPAETDGLEPRDMIEGLLENYKHNQTALKLEKNRNMAFSLAQQSSIKRGQMLQPEELQGMIDQLFACESPSVAPDGSPTFRIISLEEIAQKFT